MSRRRSRASSSRSSLTTVAVAALGLADDLPVVGDVPAGLPQFGVPDVSLDDIRTLLPAAIGIAFVAFTDTSVLSRSYAGRLHDDVDQNRELAVLGVANIATGFFQGFPTSTSSSRTAVAEDTGAGSQIAGLVGALVLALLLLFGTGLVHDLPQATLAAIVIVAVLSFIDIAALRRLRRWRRSEFVLALLAFAGVAVLGVLWGVGIAIAMSLLNFIRRAWRPHDAVLGRVDNLKGYHDTERYPDARRIPGLVIYRFDAPLFFANADAFRARVRALARSGDVRWIVVAAEPITDIDATAGESLRALDDELEAAGVELAFAELKDPVRDRLRRYGLDERIGDTASTPRSAWRSPPTCARPASTGSTGRTGRRCPSVCLMTTVEANGVTLGVEHFGDAAAPLLLLAGGTTMLSWPDALCEALARGGRHVVRYDLRDCRRVDHRRSQGAGVHAARSRSRRRGARPRTRRPAGAPGGHRRRRDGRPGRRARPPGCVLGTHARRDAARRTGPARRRPARP